MLSHYRVSLETVSYTHLSGAGEQEVDADMAFEDGEDFTAGEDDDNEPISTTVSYTHLDVYKRQVSYTS